MKINLSKILREKYLTEIISIIVIMVVMLALVGAQKWAQKIRNREAEFDKMGTVRIINMGSSKYMSTARDLANGSPISQFSKDETHNQVWQIERQGDGWRIKVVNASSCLEIGDGAQSNGAKAQLWDCTDVPQQTWKIERLEKGAYEIRLLSNDKCLEIINSSNDDGVSAQQWSCVGAIGQRWQIYSALY